MVCCHETRAPPWTHGPAALAAVTWNYSSFPLSKLVQQGQLKQSQMYFCSCYAETLVVYIQVNLKRKINKVNKKIAQLEKK